MKIESFVQQANSLRSKTIRAALGGYLQANKFDSIRVAVAYATIAGVRALLGMFSGRKVVQSNWVVGLDDALTHPGAIRLLMALPHSEVRVASLAGNSLRFHPKVMRFQSWSGSRKELMMIGSANLTSKALAGNSEAVVFLEARDANEKQIFARVWSELWTQGHVPTASELKDYANRYRAARRIREHLATRLTRTKGRRAPKAILEGDTADVDPSQANTCWIECGYITAMGRELEFKAEQGLFFGLPPTGGRQRRFRFRTSAGSIVRLRMKYQQNHMWRLQMNNDVPEVRKGLRPRRPDGKLGRSNKVAVFTRTEESDLFGLWFIAIDSRAFRKLQTSSRRHGTIGHTTTRSYGWV